MKNKVNGIFRKVCNILEWIISAILVVVVAVMCVRFVFDLGGMFDSAPVEFFETFDVYRLGTLKPAGTNSLFLVT